MGEKYSNVRDVVPHLNLPLFLRMNQHNEA